MTDHEVTVQEAAMEDLLAFALGEHRSEVAIVDTAPMVQTAEAGMRRLSYGAGVISPPSLLTLQVPDPVVDMINGPEDERDVLLLVHIKREVLDAWLAQRSRLVLV